MQHNELTETLMIAIDNALANLHTATIARVTKINAKTINCRPVINRVVDGRSIALPEFVEIIPIFLQGGTSYTAYPIAVGDYCLLVFTERCFDRWYDGQDYQPPAELRMHDYSDGVALIGLNPLAGAITIPTDIRQVGDTHSTGQQTIIGDVLITGTVTLTGDLNAEGAIAATGEVTAKSGTADVALSVHDHDFEWTDPAGSGTTDGPN